MLFGSQATQNELHTESATHHDEPEYQHIQTMREQQNVDLAFFRQVLAVEPEEMDQGTNLLDALKVGVDTLVKFGRKQKFKRRLFLITDGERAESTDPEKLKDLVEEIAANDVKLNCITLDFCNNIDEEEDEDMAQDASETEAQKTNRKFLLNI